MDWCIPITDAPSAQKSTKFSLGKPCSSRVATINAKMSFASSPERILYARGDVTLHPFVSMNVIRCDKHYKHSVFLVHAQRKKGWLLHFLNEIGHDATCHQISAPQRQCWTAGSLEEALRTSGQRSTNSGTLTTTHTASKPCIVYSQNRIGKYFAAGLPVRWCRLRRLWRGTGRGVLQVGRLWSVRLRSRRPFCFMGLGCFVNGWVNVLDQCPVIEVLINCVLTGRKPTLRLRPRLGHTFPATQEILIVFWL